jgi:4-amino-4-deoxy-L-arabinose transferase-like glycosyltransferase
LRLDKSWAVALAAGAIVLGVGCYQLAQPHVLTGVLGYNEGYDDGVYVAVATRLVHGVLPYRDFVYLHPPGMAYLMAPSAAIGIVGGSDWSLIIARIVTVIVTAANAVLVALLVRPLGKAAMAVSGFALALWPYAVFVDGKIELEPYLVFFALLGAVFLFSDKEQTTRRLFGGGFLLGSAFVVKVWGALPIAAALLVWLPQWRSRARPIVAGMVSSILGLCLPFLVVAPRAFAHDVILAQLHRQNTSHQHRSRTACSRSRASPACPPSMYQPVRP